MAIGVSSVPKMPNIKGIENFKGEKIHSGYFNDNIKLPLVWESCWHNVSIREQWESCNRKFGKKVSPENCLSSSINYFK